MTRSSTRLVLVACQLAGAALVVACLLSAVSPAIRAAQVQPQQPEEFVPIEELPPEDQLPAAPLLVTAYAFVFAALVFYVWTLWRRLGTVERELAEVARRAKAQGS